MIKLVLGGVALCAIVYFVQVLWDNWRFAHEPSAWYAIESSPTRASVSMNNSADTTIDGGPFVTRDLCVKWALANASSGVCVRMLVKDASNFPTLHGQ